MHEVLRASQVRGQQQQEKENMSSKRWWDNKHGPREPVKTGKKGERNE
jgi:hypothetical protein